MENKPAVCGRFAPSPSGRMHLGNLWSCLLAWLAARSQGGADGPPAGGPGPGPVHPGLV